VADYTSGDLIMAWAIGGYAAEYIENVAIGLWQLVLALLGIRLTETTWFWSVAVAADMLLNVIMLGDPHETISSRADKAALAGRRWGCVLCRWLNTFQQNHCPLSLQASEGARAIVPDDTP
jgi:hypothetical protein